MEKRINISRWCKHTSIHKDIVKSRNKKNSVILSLTNTISSAIRLKHPGLLDIVAPSLCLYVSLYLFKNKVLAMNVGWMSVYDCSTNWQHFQIDNNVSNNSLATHRHAQSPLFYTNITVGIYKCTLFSGWPCEVDFQFPHLNLTFMKCLSIAYTHLSVYR